MAGRGALGTSAHATLTAGNTRISTRGRAQETERERVNVHLNRNRSGASLVLRAIPRHNTAPHELGLHHTHDLHRRRLPAHQCARTLRGARSTCVVHTYTPHHSKRSARTRYARGRMRHHTAAAHTHARTRTVDGNSHLGRDGAHVRQKFSVHTAPEVPWRPPAQAPQRPRKTRRGQPNYSMHHERRGRPVPQVHKCARQAPHNRDGPPGARPRHRRRCCCPHVGARRRLRAAAAAAAAARRHPRGAPQRPPSPPHVNQGGRKRLRVARVQGTRGAQRERVRVRAHLRAAAA